MEQSRDPQMEELERGIRDLEYSICGIVEEEESQGEFKRKFIDMTNLSIEVHSSSRFEPTRE